MELKVNGQIRQVDVDEDTPLLWVIREEFNLLGTKYGCGVAQCGACTVWVDGQAVRSCIMPASAMVGKDIVTIESIENDPVGKQVVDAWIRHQVPQCGYCQSGQVMAATALLKQHPKPSDEQIDQAMSNLCRCGTYQSIRAAVRDVAGA